MICNNLKKCIDKQLSKDTLRECDNRKDDCIDSTDTRSSVKCEERGKKYIYENIKKKHVILYKMDGGVVVEDKFVPKNTNKCDYLYVINDTELTAVLTELKGVNVPKSLEQIKGTLLLYKNVFKDFGHVYARIIVTSSTPNLKASPTYINLQKTLRQTYNGNIKISERQLFEKDSDLDKM